MNEFDTTGRGGPWKLMILAGTPTVLPGAGVELRWDIDDNTGLLLRRRLPDPPSLILTVRCLPALEPSGVTIGVSSVPEPPLLTPGGHWRTRHNAPRSGSQAGAQ